jgi:uncharacterized membrane protein YfcA
MTELYIFIIAFVVSFIGILIPGMTTSLGVSSMMLLWIPIQIAKSTYQVGNAWVNLWTLWPLLKSQKLKKWILMPMLIISWVSGFIGWNILVSIPTIILMKLTGTFMIIMLLFNLYLKPLWVIVQEISRRRKLMWYISYFLLNIAYSIFPMWIWIMYQFSHTFFSESQILKPNS